MSCWPWKALYTREVLVREARELLSVLKECHSAAAARSLLQQRVAKTMAGRFRLRVSPPADELLRERDCGRALLSVLDKRAAARTGFSVGQALWDIATGRPREDLSSGFYAEMIHWVMGLEGRVRAEFADVFNPKLGLEGRGAAIARSRELDRLWGVVESGIGRFASGMDAESRVRRAARRERVCRELGATQADWNDWRWQVAHVLRDADTLGRVVPIGEAERSAITRARQGRLPFGVTPYYASLMDEEPGDRDRAVRAQVIPPADYVDQMLQHRGDRDGSCDFMLESDTSPIDLITRRYPAIVILKPFNTCPQICVYCQRNWEIDDVMAAGALASDEQIEAAIAWIENHPAIREVLITGGDPLALPDEKLREILTRLARIEHVDMIRLGTRTLVTVPMRVTEELAAMVGGFREVGRREVAVVTHVEHPYEVTEEMAAAVDRLRRAGVCVYNQQVYTFYVSRRFEATALRMLLRRVGVEPYYTFYPKGKAETGAYRVPIARLLQEQKEEARLVPGMRRTDEAVYNVPGLGKNYLRASQHRDLLAVLPDGSRVYEFHPWEKNVATQQTHLATDVPILDYLRRLEAIGENPEDYASIWYYF